VPLDPRRSVFNDVYSKQLCDMFRRGSHHTNIIVNMITQILFHPCRYCRDKSQNAHYLVALKDIIDKKQFA